MNDANEQALKGVGLAIDALQAYINGMEEIRRAGVELKARADKVLAGGGTWTAQDTADYFKWQQDRDDALKNAPVI